MLVKRVGGLQSSIVSPRLFVELSDVGAVKRADTDYPFKGDLIETVWCDSMSRFATATATQEYALCLQIAIMMEQLGLIPE